MSEDMQDNYVIWIMLIKRSIVLMMLYVMVVLIIRLWCFWGGRKGVNRDELQYMQDSESEVWRCRRNSHTRQHGKRRHQPYQLGYRLDTDT